MISEDGFPFLITKSYNRKAKVGEEVKIVIFFPEPPNCEKILFIGKKEDVTGRLKIDLTLKDPSSPYTFIFSSKTETNFVWQAELKFFDKFTGDEITYNEPLLTEPLKIEFD